MNITLNLPDNPDTNITLNLNLSDNQHITDETNKEEIIVINLIDKTIVYENKGLTIGLWGEGDVKYFNTDDEAKGRELCKCLAEAKDNFKFIAYGHSNRTMVFRDYDVHYFDDCKFPSFGLGSINFVTEEL